MNRITRLSVACLMLTLLLRFDGVAYADLTGSTITVDTESDEDTRDGGLSLREAIELGNGSLTFCLTDHEKGQVSGAAWVYQPPAPNCSYNPVAESRWNVQNGNSGLGSGYVDHIVFTGDVGTITLGTKLPNVDDSDNIDGGAGKYGGKVRLVGSGISDGNGITVHVDCIDCGTHSHILNLVLNGFPGDGVNIDGQAANGVVLQGLEIYNNSNGIYIATGGDLNTRNVLIGGGNASQRNVIYCNRSNGIELLGTNSADFGSDFGNTIQNNYIGVKSDGKTKCANGVHGIYFYNMRGNTISGNVLSGNGGDGLKLAGQGSINNLVVSNNIGSDAGGSIKIGNTFNGITLSGAANNNQIGSSGQGNFVIGNGLTGIALYDSGTTGNMIAYNIVGPGGGNYGGARIVAGASQNTLQQNWIGSNTTFGVLIDGSGTTTNTLVSNKIGTNFGGTSAMANGTNGVQIQNGASANVIGLSGQGNLISGNGNDGVQIAGSGTNFNQVYANTIGLSTSQLAMLGNGQSGVSVLGGAQANRIGGAGKGNTIAGNGNAGVYIANPNTLGTLVYGNDIGTNSFSTTGIGNAGPGVGIYDQASDSFIGEYSGVPEGAGNLISGNGGPGVDIANGGTRFNGVYNNWIGLNAGGGPLPNAIGIRLYGGTTNNTLGGTGGRGNVISGNGGPGVGLYDSGTNTNTVSSNYIGTNVAGTAAISNTQQGIIIQQASASNVITNNVVSGNGADGILIYNSGSDFNVISHNWIGTNAAGTAAVPNTYSGVAVIGGPYSTTIGGPSLGDRNLISGNNSYGVYVQGANTISTTIRMNLIGLNASGAAAMPNGTGVAIFGAAGTLVGSNGDGGGRYQYISGNAGQGLYISGASGTQIAFSTRIGFAGDGVSPLGNGFEGIVLNNAVNNSVSGLIAHNGRAGVAVTGNGAFSNTVLPLWDFSNGGLAIDLGNDGFTPNGSHVGAGPNGWLGYPVIITTTGSTITGTVCANCVVAAYLAVGAPNAPGGGGQFTGAEATADGSGTFMLVLPGGLTPSNTALIACQPQCSGYSNTSEFSPLYLPSNLFLPLMRK